MILLVKNINPNKLNDEFAIAGINSVISNDQKDNEHIAENTWITFEEDTNMALVQQIIDAHDPTPLPMQPTEIEQLRIESAQANAELFEMMLMMTGGI